MEDEGGRGRGTGGGGGEEVSAELQKSDEDVGGVSGHFGSPNKPLWLSYKKSSGFSLRPFERNGDVKSVVSI